MEKIKVFISCPSDVEEEFLRDIIKAIDNLNIAIRSFEKEFEPIHYTTKLTSRKCVPRIQDEINSYLTDCEIAICLLWARFGSPPGKDIEGNTYGSGTEEEMLRAIKLMPKYVSLLLCHRPIDPHEIDNDQHKNVIEFIGRIEKGKQVFHQPFKDAEELRTRIMEILSNYIEENKGLTAVDQKEIRSTEEGNSSVEFKKFNRGFDE